jgi:hypothetical protein
MSTQMYNVDVQFEGQEEIVTVGVEGVSEEDVYNFLPCIFPKDVAYEVVNIVLDEDTTPDLERKKQAKNQELKNKYEQKYLEFLSICENMDGTEIQGGMAIVLDNSKEEFFICPLKEAKSLDNQNFKIMVAAEPNEENDDAVVEIGEEE